MMKTMAKPLSKRKGGARLGQHFLLHPRIAERITNVASLTLEDTVLEVGPGRGILTAALLERLSPEASAKEGGAEVVAVEADASLIEGLRERFSDALKAGRLTLVHADIRDYLAGEAPELPARYAVVANIPYYLTGELIRALLTRTRQPSSMTLLVQKEVALRIVARDTKPLDSARGKESLLSLSVKAYGTPSYEFTVPRGAFKPAPRVDSAVISVRDISRGHFKAPADEERFFALIHAGFAHKRKYLRSNLAAAGLTQGSVPEKARAEDLSLDDWFVLAEGG